jgi:protocatechuate 3,4-dioxygenase beta subunit
MLQAVLLGGVVLALPLRGPAQPAAPAAAQFWRDGDPGTRLYLRGRVLGRNGEPLVGVQVQLRQADGAGDYQPDRYRGMVNTGARGTFSLDTALPGQYYGAKHIHVILSHPRHGTVTTSILFKGDPNLPAGEADRAVLLEEVNRDGETVLVGNVELVMAPPGGR